MKDHVRMLDRSTEQTGSTVKICLNCDRWRLFSIRSTGWWVPNCLCWNRAKSSKEKPYGPTLDCPFSLEHSMIDNRRGFLVASKKIADKVVEFYVNNCDVVETKFGVVDVDRHGAKKVDVLNFIRGGDGRKVSITFSKVHALVNAVNKILSEYHEQNMFEVNHLCDIIKQNYEVHPKR